MTPLVLLSLYAAALTLSSLLGGHVPRYFAMTHTRTQLAMSFVSGVMLGIAFLHLLPHALAETRGEHAVSYAMNWTIAGLATMLLLLRLLHFHQPDFPLDEGAQLSNADTVPKSWVGVLIGLLVHTAIDGMALGAAMLGAPQRHDHSIIGLGIFLAIALHKPLDAISITSLMKAGGATARSQNLVNLGFALACPLAAVLVFLIVGGSPEIRSFVMAPMLAFSAGAFICIALGDLLPEVQFHRHDRLKLALVFLLGIGVAYAIEMAAPQHSHSIGQAASLSEH